MIELDMDELRQAIEEGCVVGPVVLSVGGVEVCAFDRPVDFLDVEWVAIHAIRPPTTTICMQVAWSEM